MKFHQLPQPIQDHYKGSAAGIKTIIGRNTSKGEVYTVIRQHCGTATDTWRFEGQPGARSWKVTTK